MQQQFTTWSRIFECTCTCKVQLIGKLDKINVLLNRSYQHSFLGQRRMRYFLTEYTKRIDLKKLWFVWTVYYNVEWILLVTSNKLIFFYSHVKLHPAELRYVFFVKRYFQKYLRLIIIWSFSLQYKLRDFCRTDLTTTLI